MIIYKTTNLINGKFYVGKDASNNPNYYGSGLLLAKAIKKYGKENFKKEILEECQSLKDLNIREKYWIASLDACAILCASPLVNNPPNSFWKAFTASIDS